MSSLPQGYELTSRVDAIIDPVALLRRYLSSASEDEALQCRTRLIEDQVAPHIRKIVIKKIHVDPCRSVGRQGPREEAAQNVYCDANLALIQQMEKWRQGTAEPPEADKLLGYVSAIAYNACKNVRLPSSLSAEPQARVFYALTRGQGLALWLTPHSEQIGGYALWRDEGRQPASSKIREELQRDPVAFARAGLKQRDPSQQLRRCTLLELLRSLLDQADAPLPCEDLSEAIAALSQKNARIEEVSMTIADKDQDREHDLLQETLDAGVNIEAQTVESDHLRDFLRRLWPEILNLPLRHRIALLLNFTDCDLRRLPPMQIASFADIAQAVGKSPGELAQIWNQLPLNDVDLARELALTEAQVKNLRQSAYRTLAWHMRPFDRGALRRLWQRALEIEPPRPLIFMLYARDAQGASLLALLPRESIAKREEMADKLHLPQERLDRIWPLLPLGFAQIATLLEKTPQQVALLYSEARRLLKQALIEVEKNPT